MASQTNPPYEFGTGVSSYGGRPGDVIHVLLRTSNQDDLGSPPTDYDLSITVPEGWSVAPTEPGVTRFTLKPHESRGDYVLMTIGPNAAPGFVFQPVVIQTRNGDTSTPYVSFGKTLVAAVSQ